MSGTQIERLTRVEEQVNELRIKVDAIDKKLDELLVLRNKGAGVFWFISVLMGIGVVGVVGQILHYIGVK